MMIMADDVVLRQTWPWRNKFKEWEVELLPAAAWRSGINLLLNEACLRHHE